MQAAGFERQHAQVSGYHNCLRNNDTIVSIENRNLPRREGLVLKEYFKKVNIFTYRRTLISFW